MSTARSEFGRGQAPGPHPPHLPSPRAHARLDSELAPRTVPWGWALSGLILIVVHFGLFLLSSRFPYGEDVLNRPTVQVVGLLIIAGVVYLSAVWLLKQPFVADMRWWVWVLAVGLVMRAVMLPSTPMMDNDYYRYLWDGAMVAHGHSPYAFAPQEIIAELAPEEIAELASRSAEVIERVNHPWLRSIYPPGAQAAFGVAHFIAPWQIVGLRIVWLVADAATLLLLVFLLRVTGSPPHFLLIYWWNPLLVKETYNTAHMDIFILPFVVGALLLAVLRHRIFSAVILGLAAAIKLWPVVLLPVLVRRKAVTLGSAISICGVVLSVAGLSTLPLFASEINPSSGLRAYASYWEMNDSVYVLLHAVGVLVAPENPHTVARSVAAILLTGWVVWLCRVPAKDGRDMCERALWVIAGLFLVSPTQFPWYWLWLLPLLTVTPSFALLVLTATLPLYYLRFPMQELGYTAWFDYGVVWLEFAPALALLAWKAFRSLEVPVLAASHTWRIAIHED